MDPIHHKLNWTTWNGHAASMHADRFGKKHTQSKAKQQTKQIKETNE
jgi:hypothetical protein